ncbi:DNA-binding transcriptional regulator Fis [Legionella israelensis]|nr:DNA-binding transcriptional regulator Fis [Legionella israelensis]
MCCFLKEELTQMTTISSKIGDATASLAESVTQSVQKYFSELNGTDPVDLYQFVLEEIETPLFRAVMEHCKYNQSRAAIMLGISRGTLRTKLRRYFDDKYVGTRE